MRASEVPIGGKSRVRLAATEATLLLAAASSVASAQEAEWRVEGGARSDALGTRVLWLDDVDGDGTRDFAVAATGRSGSTVATGRVEVWSGATRSLLRSIESSVAGDGFGGSLARFDDLDGDGVGELLVAARQRWNPAVWGAIGAVVIVSPATGTALRTDYASTTTDALGHQVVALDDVDGDAVADYLSCANVVELRSGASGATIRTHAVDVSLGDAPLAALADIDGDAVGDYAIGNLFAGPSSRIELRSGTSGALLHVVDSTTFNDPDLLFGGSIAAAGDLDGDGVDDLVGAGSMSSRWLDGTLFAISGASGALAWRVDGTPGLDEQLGAVIAVGGDSDGDGDRDLLSSCASLGVETFDLATGARGGLLATPQPPLAFVLDVDLGGDGRPELLVGSPGIAAAGQLAGAGWFAVWDPVAAARLVEGWGEKWDSRFGAASIVIEDRDGDGWRELAVGVPGGFGDARGHVSIISGRDGSELARVASSVFGDEFGAALAAVADQDGDGLVEWLVGAPGAAGGGEVELLSGGSGARLLTFAAPTGAARFGSVVATAGDANGRWRALVGDASAKVGTTTAGRIDLLDLASGATLASRNGTLTRPFLGICAAAIGDVTGDGVPDLAVGSEFESASVYYGNLTLLDGATLAVVWSVDGNGAGGSLGRSVSAVGDLDGDGVADLVTGHVDGLLFPSSTVSARSGGDGSPIWSYLDSHGGRTAVTSYGETIRGIGDVDGDGLGDLLVGAPVTRTHFAAPWHENRGWVDLRSGANGARLKRWYGPLGEGTCHGASLGAAGVDGSHDLDGDGLPEMVAGGENTRTSAPRRSYLEIRRLSPTLLELDPPDAYPNYGETIAVRGGPPGNLAGIFLVDFAGIPVNAFALLGPLDAASNLSFFDVVPGGLAGLTMTFRGYAIGWSGRVERSPDEVLTFR